MTTSNTLSSGLLSGIPATTVAVKKPLTASDPTDVSACIETITGRLVNPTCPTAKMIDLTDIAWALSRIPRFAGHTITEVPYNVAQHSVYVSELVEEFLVRCLPNCEEIKKASANIISIGNINEVLIKALLHDAHEAYIGDIPSPIKKIPELHETYKIMEGRLDHAIRTYFNLSELTDDERLIIKFCDKLAQAIEGYQFMPSRGLNWNLPKPSITQLQLFSAPLTPLESYKGFLSRLDYLQSQ